MNFYSIRTNDQETIEKILSGQTSINVPKLSWHRDKVKVGDLIFIVISGDDSRKNIPYINGLRAIGKIMSKPISEDKKHFSLDIEVSELFPKTLTKNDFYNYPELKDVANIGPETKSAPNQAFRYISNKEGMAVLSAVRDLGVQSRIAEENVQEDFVLKKLSFNSSSYKEQNKIIRDFILWFFEPRNYLKSYDGLVTYSYLDFIDQNFFSGEIFRLDDTPIQNQIQSKYDLISNKNNEKFVKFNLATAKGIPSAILGKNNFLKFLNEKYGTGQLSLKENLKAPIFNITNFEKDILISNLNLSKEDELLVRFTASLLTKPFVILTGLTGSGKTKIAQSFAEWICENGSQYKIVPVGADWTNREPLLGYPNGLHDDKYVLPDSGVLDLILQAEKDYRLPHFLILDEMNLSHVERYFADFLSIMETGKTISLYSGEDRKDSTGEIVPKEITWPENLFIVGTVNIDETTYMFSPKVLDRANVIEFRLNEADLMSYFAQNSEPGELLNGKGAAMAEDFLKLSKEKSKSTDKAVREELIKFFNALSEVGAEFGYRSVKEILILTEKLKQIDSTISLQDQIDIAVMQKLLPKLHGSRSKLIQVLEELMKLCSSDLDIKKILDKTYEPMVIYPLSYGKLKRMYKNAIANGFASYAEA